MKSTFKLLVIGGVVSACGLGPYGGHRKTTSDGGATLAKSANAGATGKSIIQGDGYEDIKGATATRIQDENGDKIKLAFEGTRRIVITFRIAKGEGTFQAGVNYADRAAGPNEGEERVTSDQQVSFPPEQDPDKKPNVKPALGDVSFRLAANGNIELIEAGGMTASPKTVYSLSGENIPIQTAPSEDILQNVILP